MARQSLMDRQPHQTRNMFQYLSIDRTGVSYNSLDRAYGFSVRCIQTKFGVPATNDPVDPSTQDIIMFKKRYLE
jgi:hypothetical protein